NLRRQQEIDDLRRQIEDAKNALENGGDTGGGGSTGGSDDGGGSDPNAEIFQPPKRNFNWGNASTGTFDIGQIPSGQSMGSATDLVAANTNGNKGFQY